MEEAILASGCEMVTVAMKRIELDDKEDDMLKHIIHPQDVYKRQTFYSTFITLFHQTPHSQYKTKVFFTYYQDIRSR